MRSESRQRGLTIGCALWAIGLWACTPGLRPDGDGPDAATGRVGAADGGAPEMSAPDGATWPALDGGSPEGSLTDAGGPPPVGSSASGLEGACERDCLRFETCGSTQPRSECEIECTRVYSPLVDLGCTEPTERLLECLGEAVSVECRALAVVDACPDEKTAMRTCRERACRVDPTVGACAELCQTYCDASLGDLDCAAVCASELEEAHRLGCDAPAWDWALCRALGLAETVDGIRCYTVSVELEGCLSRGG